MIDNVPFGLTDAEHRFVALLAEAMSLFATEIVAGGMQRVNDINEMAALIHAPQRMVLAQAAARAYPNLYRRLGYSTLYDDPDAGPAPEA